MVKTNKLYNYFTKNKNNILNQVTIFSICLIGFALRLRQYLTVRSFWIDEAMLANNILSKSLINLVRYPLLNNQSAPPGFLALVKFSVLYIGNSENVFRLLPFITGCLSIPLIFIFSQKISNNIVSIISLTLFSITPKLIYYSSEIKQYSTDLFLFLLISLVIYFCLNEKTKNIIFLGLIGTIAIWFSNPVIFVLFGATCILSVDYIINKKYKNLSWLIVVSIFWGISFTIQYILVLQYSASNNYLISFWQSSFAPFPPWIDFSWYKNTFQDILHDPLYLPISLITVLLLIIGCLSLGLRKWRYLLMLILPILLALIASALKKYPFSGRLMLFLVPSFLIILSEGIDWIKTKISKINHLASAAVTLSLVLYLIIQPLSFDFRNFINPTMRESIRPVIIYIKKKMTPSDTMYVYYSAEPAFTYYLTRYKLPSNNIIIGSNYRETPFKYIDEIDKLQGTKRIWFLFSHPLIDEQNLILDHLNKKGHLLNKTISDGSSAYLYDLSKTK